MCGIVGIVGHSQVAPLIVDVLKRLEYRGYNSAGVATIQRGELARRRAEGKLINLERRLKDEPLEGTIGIGHTRWATHGVPNETNAHPHLRPAWPLSTMASSRISPNWRDELKLTAILSRRRPTPRSSAIWWRVELAKGLKPVEAAHQALKRLQGAFALAIMFKGDEDLIVPAPAMARLWPSATAMARCSWAQHHRVRPIHQFDHLSDMATGRWCAATAWPSSTSTAKKSSASASSRCRPASWSIRVTDAISWKRKSMNSPK